MQVTIAENVIGKTNQRVLILTPLAVLSSFIDKGHPYRRATLIHEDGTFTKDRRVQLRAHAPAEPG